MNTEFITNLCFFLLQNVGSVYGHWSGKMTAVQQRELFGRFIGKGEIHIDGNEEVIFNRVKVCFGMDWDDRNYLKWKDL